MSVRRTLHRVRPLAVGILFAGAVAAAPQREPLPAPSPAPSSPAQVQQGSEGVHVPASVSVERVGALPDVPDFVPLDAERDADGAVRAVRPRGDAYVLSFVGGDYAPAPGIDPDLALRLAMPGVTHTYGFVMIQGRMTDERMDVLRKLGLTLYGAHTWQCVKAKIPAAALQGLAGLPFVRWVGYARPHQKLDLELARALAGAEDDAVFEVVVSPFESDLNPASRRVVRGPVQEPQHTTGVVDAVELPVAEWIPNGPMHGELVAQGFRFDWFDELLGTFKGRATKRQILAIGALDRVHAIELHLDDRHCHDQAMGMIGQDHVRATLGGAGVPVGIIDSGIDGSPWHQDFYNKLFVGWSTVGRSVFADGSGHGTHVAGTVFGTGLADERYRGAAPAVGHGGEGNRIFIGAFLDDSGSSSGSLSTHLSRFSSDQVLNGRTNPRPVLVSNSYGRESSGGWNGTDTNSRLVDQAVWANGQCYVFAAGNKDKEANWWVTRPGAAKNALTVGSVDDSWDGSVAGWASWFTRWRTPDGRIKPDVAAPGRSLTSCRLNSTNGYMTMMGTSMATPMVTGALASVVQRSSYYRGRPEALKALAMSAAKLDGLPATHALTPLAGRLGHGLISSTRMNGLTGTAGFRVFTSALTSGGTGRSHDVAIPSNVKAVKVLLTWIEPPTSTLAAQARGCDLRLWIDVPAYSPSINGGDYQAASASDNTVWYAGRSSLSNSIAAQMVGKTVRFKVYAQSVGLGFAARYALCVFYYYRDPQAGTGSEPTLAVDPETRYLQPGADFRFRVGVSAQAGLDGFDSARILYGGPFAVVGLSRKTLDGLTQSYFGDSAAWFPSWPFPRVSNLGWGAGMTVGQGRARYLDFKLRASATPGVYTLQGRATWHGTTSSSTPELSDAIQVCVDGTPPPQVTGLRNLNGKLGGWTLSNSLIVAWNPVSDPGCAGLAGYAVKLSEGAAAVPAFSDLGSLTPSVHEAVPHDSSRGFYLNVRPFDRAGNGPATASVGPFFVDRVRPVVSSVSINGGAATTTSTMVKVHVTATDDRSGLAEMSFSSDRVTWGAWVPYSTLAQNYDLKSNGGSASPGTHYVYARVRDRAGNVSGSGSDSIQLANRPVLRSASQTTVSSVNHDRLTLLGTYLAGVTRVQFGAAAITTRWSGSHDDAWATGSFHQVSAQEVHVWLPQGLPPGAYPLSVVTAAGQSAALRIDVVRNPKPEIRSSAALTAGKVWTLMLARGDATASHGILVLSPDPRSSSVPGVVDLQIGNGFSAVVQLPQMPFDAGGVLKVTVPTLATFRGIRAYMQGVCLTPALPLAVSDVWVTVFQ